MNELQQYPNQYQSGYHAMANRSTRSGALRTIGFFAGGLLLRHYWPTHPIWGFFIGSSLGLATADLITG